MLQDHSFTRERITFWGEYHLKSQTEIFCWVAPTTKTIASPKLKFSVVKAIFLKISFQENWKETYFFKKKKKKNVGFFQLTWNVFFSYISFLMQHSTFRVGIHIWLASAMILRVDIYQNSIKMQGTKLQGALTKLMAWSVSWEMKPRQQVW